MEDMEVEYYDDPEKGNERGVKRSWLEINEEVRKDRWVRAKNAN
jgi:hypothetical protein